MEVKGDIIVAEKAVLTLIGDIKADARAIINGTIVLGKEAAAFVEFEAGKH